MNKEYYVSEVEDKSSVEYSKRGVLKHHVNSIKL